MGAITYKNKLILLAVGILLLFYFIFKLSISETLLQKQRNADNLITLETIINAPKEIEVIQKEIENFSEKMGNTVDTTWHNEPFLEFLSKSCKKYSAVLNDYTSPHIFAQNDFRVETRTAIIGGRFFDLISVLNDVERNYTFGKSVSANFSLKEDLRSNTRHLYLTLFVQSVIEQNKTVKN